MGESGFGSTGNSGRLWEDGCLTGRCYDESVGEEGIGVMENLENERAIVGLDWIPGVGLLRRLSRIGVFRVKGRSMEPNYFAGELLVVWGAGGGEDTLSRGDVVVFEHPSVKDRMMLKRVLALPGERVGMVADRTMVDGMTTSELGSDVELWEIEWKLGEDEWFVVGDNSGASLDSRRLGPVKGSWIRGRVWFRYWPFLRFGGGGD